jgi:cell division protein FtsI/penicillin-binding protein 2
MVKTFQHRRLALLASLMIAVFCGLGYRLVELQVVRHDELRLRAQANTQRVMLREPRRGEIRDVRGNQLATSVPVRVVCADPSIVGERFEEMARVLAPLLNTNEMWLAERLRPRVVRTNDSREQVFDKYVVLKHSVKVEDWERIQSVLKNQSFGHDLTKLKRTDKSQLYALRHKAIFTEDEQMRVYPAQALAAHILGYTGASNEGELIGVDGIERVMNSKLSGVRGWRQTEKDNRGRELVALRQQDVEARDGLNVVLTIDAGVQHIVETELMEIMAKFSPASVSAIVLRPRTGEILAMGSRPTFDPNQPGKFPVANLRNRMTFDNHEPGSTFKIVSIGAALNAGLTTLGERIDCERGAWTFKGKVLHDHEHYGLLTVEEVMMKSSNIGSAKIGLRLGDRGLFDYLTAFGFGERTGIPLPGESSGLLIPVKKWDGLTASRVSIGHSAAATPLQMAMAMAAIANGGKLMRPLLVDRLEDSEGRLVLKHQPQVVREVFKPEVSKQVVETLKRVVSTDGTAEKARLAYYTAAGKTGTAQKIENGQYSHSKYFSSFIGFFPADNPELLIYVCVDEPDKAKGYYGGQVAAPSFRNIAEKAANYLNIRPEVEKETLPAESRTQTKTAARLAVKGN